MKITQLLILLLVLVSLTCDLHYITDIYQPEIEIISPKASDECIGEVHIELHATDNYELREIKLYFDGDVIKTWEVTGEEAIVTYTIDLTDYSKSKDYEIKVQVWDKVGNWRKLTQENYGIRKDCNGVIDGSAIIDDCGVCSGGNTGHEANSDQDCNGDCFGDAFINACDDCVGGNTGLAEDYCTMTDIDGNIYETVQIGDQIWMAENLKVTHYRDGTAIPTGHSNSEWGNLSTGAYCVYDGNETNTYGYLYNWYAVDDSRNIAPAGWHVPTDEEWTILTNYLGGSSVAGGKMKETGTSHWNSPNTGATNESGFTALPGGYRSNSNGNYYNLGNYGYFWSSTESNNNAWIRVLTYNGSEVFRGTINKNYGFSVRLVRTVE